MARIGQYRVPDEIHSHHIHKRGVIAMAVHEQYDIPESEKDKRSSPYNFYIVQQKPLSENYMNKLEKRYKFTIPAKNRKTYINMEVCRTSMAISQFLEKFIRE